jgi:hypothetical protein
MINPYNWPFSFFKIMTDPYFKFWAKILPGIKLEKRSLDISVLIAIEALDTFVYFIIILANEILKGLEKTEILLRS